MSADLTARIAELAATIGRQLQKDETVAEDAQRVAPRPWLAANSLLLIQDADGVYGVEVAAVDDYRYDEVFIHAARQEPARALRRVRATRVLVAEILAEQHRYVEDGWYSCSQATEPGEDDAEPGSACYDDNRAGKPCDCGRDEHVARMLGIIASEWEETR